MLLSFSPGKLGPFGSQEPAGMEAPSSFLGGELQLLDVTAFQPKAGERKRREGLARGPADDAAEGAAPSNNGQRELPRVVHLGEKPGAFRKERCDERRRYSSSGRARASVFMLQKSMVDGLAPLLGETCGERNANL